MTINSNSVWGSAQSYSSSSVQSQSSASGMAPSGSNSVSQQAVSSLVASLDTNKSGGIDKAEFSQAAQALAKTAGSTYNVDSAFSTIDKDGDGSISVDEFTNALKQSQVQGGGHHHGHHHHADATASSSQLSQQTASSTDTATSSSKMQSVLMQRILSAYTSNGPASSSITATA